MRLLTHFSPVSHFYTRSKRQKTKGFMTFSGGIEMWHWTKMGIAASMIFLPQCQPTNICLFKFNKKKTVEEGVKTPER